MKPGRKITKFAASVGIDWSDKKQDLCEWDAEKQTVHEEIIEHRPERLVGKYLFCYGSILTPTR